MDRWLRYLTYIAVITLCFVRVYAYWDNYRTKPKLPAQTVAARLIGSKIDPNATGAVGGTRGTIAIAMSTSCVFCKASAPFYRALLGKARRLPGDLRTVAVMPESHDAANRYLRDSLLLTFDAVVQHLPGVVTAFTPTLLLADERGVVKGAWVGLLKPPAEDEVMATLCNVVGLDATDCRSR